MYTLFRFCRSPVFICLFDWLIERRVCARGRSNKLSAKASTKLIMIHSNSHIWITVHFIIYCTQTEPKKKQANSKCVHVCYCVCDCREVHLLFHYYGVSNLHQPVWFDRTHSKGSREKCFHLLMKSINIMTAQQTTNVLSTVFVTYQKQLWKFLILILKQIHQPCKLVEWCWVNNFCSLEKKVGEMDEFQWNSRKTEVSSDSISNCTHEMTLREKKMKTSKGYRCSERTISFLVLF